MIKTKVILLVSCVAMISACGGGGGGGGTSDTVSSSGLAGASHWEARAAVSADNCGERIAPVRQIFAVDGDRIDTGIVVVPVTATSDGYTFGLSESNGNCSRNYVGEFSTLSGSTANVHFKATSTCNGATCQSEWTGTATKLN